jgi:hypothetical protein
VIVAWIEELHAVCQNGKPGAVRSYVCCAMRDVLGKSDNRTDGRDASTKVIGHGRMGRMQSQA